MEAKKDHLDNLEHRALDEGGPRVKFHSQWKDDVQSFLKNLPKNVQTEFHNELMTMADALWEMEEAGAAPVLPDGKVGGNAAFRLQINDEEQVIVLSRSGKTSGHKFDLEKDVCIITDFDIDEWAAEYLAVSKDVLPTSDTPMHHAALNAHKQYQWKQRPNAILHGHALETEEEAHRCGLPISTEETLFSTPEDTAALMSLFEAHPYPDSKIYIRKGHGFLLLAESMHEALKTFRNVIKPQI